MFIKVFVPNANGKIELTVQELEALLKDAAAKAVSEKCASCNKSYYIYNSNDWNSISTAPNITLTDKATPCGFTYVNDISTTGTVSTNNKGE